MKRKKKFFNRLSIVCGAIAFCLSFISCMREMSESSMDPIVDYNGSFEEIKESLPINWLVYTSKTAGAGDFSITADTSTYADGNQSLKFLVNNCSPLGGWRSPGIAQEIPVTAGDTYHLSFFLKNEGTAFSVKISSVTAFEGVEGPSFQSSESINEWKKYEYVYQIPANMKRLRFEVNVLSEGVFWIDKVEIEKQINS